MAKSQKVDPWGEHFEPPLEVLVYAAKLAIDYYGRRKDGKQSYVDIAQYLQLNPEVLRSSVRAVKALRARGESVASLYVRVAVGWCKPVTR